MQLHQDQVPDHRFRQLQMFANREGNILENRQIGKKRSELEQHPHAPAGSIQTRVRHRIDLFPIETHTTLARLDLATDQSKQRRLSGATPAHNRDDLASREPDIQIPQNGIGAIGKIDLVELDQLFSESDFVSLHPPLTPKTRQLMNDDAFGKMKKSAVLINCSRGPVMDTDALVRALDAGTIAGCALDTTDPEPLPDPHALRGRENVIINPHAAWYSEQAMKGLQAGAPGEVARVLGGQWPVNVVNPAVRGNNRAGL